MRIKLIIFFLLFTLNNYPAYSSDVRDEFINANNFIMSGEFQKAKSILYKILKKNPDNMQIINNIAYIEAKSGNLEKAIEMLRSYIRNNDDVDIVYKNLTNLYAYQANIIYEEALSIDESESKDINLSLIKNLKLENKNLGPNDITTEERNLIKDLQITKKDIEDFIINWAKYWENKDYDNYFNCYEENYFPENFQSKKSWMSDRKSKIKNKNKIDIKIKNINIISDFKENILIQFTQSYNSDSFSDVVKKHTTAVVSNGDIKITGEYILK